MTEEEAMQKAREVLVGRRLAFMNESGPQALIDAFAAALMEASRAGAEREMAVWVERYEDKVGGLEADLENAVEVAWKRGAIDWVRLNYPKHYARFAAIRNP